ncbi:hypothetical protein C4577_05150 [Candidatus Parcubacteria bacterium]|nr:MAG: hypothetical protein C4577_05150 [Candidatus Parcubacteria bacterium]
MKKAKKTVYKNYSFFWNTNLSNGRMKEIDKWIGTLTPERKDMIRDLLKDERDEAFYDAYEEYGIE